MVRSLISKMIEKHLHINDYDNEVVTNFKQTVVTQLRERIQKNKRVFEFLYSDEVWDINDALTQ